MAKIFECIGSRYNYAVITASGAKTAGAFHALGTGENGYILNDIADTYDGLVVTGGRTKAKKNEALAISAGDALYYNSTNSNVDKTDTGVLVGRAEEDAASADTHVIMQWVSMAAFLKA